jgi:hypothetical protein
LAAVVATASLLRVGRSNTIPESLSEPAADKLLWARVCIGVRSVTSFARPKAPKKGPPADVLAMLENILSRRRE